MMPHGPIFGTSICVMFWYMHTYMNIYECECEFVYWYTSDLGTRFPMVPFFGPVYVLYFDICICIFIHINVSMNSCIDIVVGLEHDSPWSYFGPCIYFVFIYIHIYVCMYMSVCMYGYLNWYLSESRTRLPMVLFFSSDWFKWWHDSFVVCDVAHSYITCHTNSQCDVTRLCVTWFIPDVTWLIHVTHKRVTSHCE